MYRLIMTLKRPTPPPGKVSLERALSKLGLASRTDARKLIADGKVSVDGRIATRGNLWVNPQRSKIRIEGVVAVAAVWRCVVFHKPRGVVTTRRDERGRKTIYDVLPSELHGLMPVGRLDQHTSGLLILTNDTRLSSWIMDPHNGVHRTYIVEVRGEASPEKLIKLESGVVDRAEKLKAHEVRALKVSGKESRLSLVLQEGKNREVRRLCMAVGLEVTALKRISLGRLALGELRPGGWEELTREQVLAGFKGLTL